MTRTRQCIRGPCSGQCMGPASETRSCGTPRSMCFITFYVKFLDLLHGNKNETIIPDRKILIIDFLPDVSIQYNPLPNLIYFFDIPENFSYFFHYHAIFDLIQFFSKRKFLIILTSRLRYEEDIHPFYL